MTLASWIDFQSLQDPRGRLIVAEADRHIPFAIRRVYYLRDLHAAEPRGFHAHRDLRQVMLCVTGSCEVVLDNGRQREVVTCDDPARALLVDRMIWHEMQNFSVDAVFLVFASDVYREDDYIRNYDNFRHAVSSTR